MDVALVRQPFFEPILRTPDARPSMQPVEYIPLHWSLAPDHVPDTLERLLEDSLAFGPPLPAAPASGDSLLEDTLLEDTPVVGPPAAPASGASTTRRVLACMPTLLDTPSPDGGEPLAEVSSAQPLASEVSSLSADSDCVRSDSPILERRKRRRT